MQIGEFPDQQIKYSEANVEKEFQHKVIHDSGHQRAVIQNSVDISQARDLLLNLKYIKQVSSHLSSVPEVIPSMQMNNQLRGVCVRACICVHVCMCTCVCVLSYVHVRRYVVICVCITYNIILCITVFSL